MKETFVLRSQSFMDMYSVTPDDQSVISHKKTHLKSQLKVIDHNMRERFLSHCAINQLNFWLHKRSHKAAIQILYKANNPSWEESTAQYVSLILSLIDQITSKLG
jgi:hypothetical protein